jgi:hypothetical protein
MTVILGSSFYDADPDTMRRQAGAMDALASVPDVVAVDLQWRGHAAQASLDPHDSGAPARLDGHHRLPWSHQTDRERVAGRAGPM